MALHPTTRPKMDSTAHTQTDVRQPMPRGARIAIGALGAIVAWCALAGGMAFLWEHGFDFPTGEAWALSIGLAAMIAMLIGLLLTVMVALRREEESDR